MQQIYLEMQQSIWEIRLAFGIMAKEKLASSLNLNLQPNQEKENPSF